MSREEYKGRLIVLTFLSLEFQEFYASPFFQPFWVPLDDSSAFQHNDCFQFGAISKLR